MQKNFLKVLLGALIVLSVGVGPVRAQDPWGLSDDVPTWFPGENWDYHRSFTISLDGVLADLGGGLAVLIDGELEFEDDFTLEVNASTPSAVVNTGFLGFQNSMAYVRNRTAGALTLLSGTARLTLSQDGVEIPGEYVDIVLTLNPLDSSIGLSNVGVSDLSQIREQFQTPVTNGTITAPTGTVNLCDLVDGLSSGALVCGGPAAPFQAALDLALLHAVHQNNLTTGGLELLDFPTIDPVTGNGTGESWTAFGFRGVDGDLTLNVPALGLNTVASVDFSTSASIASSLMDKNIADPAGFATDNRHVQSTVWGVPEDIYYSPAAKELSYWKIANFSATTSDGLIVGLVDFTTELVAANVGPAPSITITDMNPPRPLYGQAFTVSGTIGMASGNVNVELQIPGLGGSSVTAAISIPNTFSVVVNAPTKNDGTVSSVSSTERETGSWGLRVTGIGMAAPNQKVATIRLAVPTAANGWNLYE